MKRYTTQIRCEILVKLIDSEQMGEMKKAITFFMIAAHLTPKVFLLLTTNLAAFYLTFFQGCASVEKNRTDVVRHSKLPPRSVTTCIIYVAHL